MLQLLGSLIRHVADRPGHDRRYALDCSKLHALGWQPRQRFEDALAATVEWYRQNQDWWQSIRNGSFAAYYQRADAQREGFTPAPAGQD